MDITEAESKIRKIWLWLHVIIPAVYLVIILLPLAVFISLQGNNSGALVLFVTGMEVALGVCLSYYCAYKKPGTVWLVLDMCGRAVWMIAAICVAISMVKKSIIVIPLSLFYVTLQLVYMYYSNELYKINAKLQKMRLKSSALYLKSLEVFSTATNMDELNDLYRELKPHCKSTCLSEAYRQHKRKLSLQSLNLQ